MLTTSADSFFKKNLVCLQLIAFILLPFHRMLLFQVRAKIVTSPWVAEVFEIGGPFHILWQTQHTCHLTWLWITCWNFKAIPQCPIWLVCLDFTLWFWHNCVMWKVLVLVLVHLSFSILPPWQCYKNTEHVGDVAPYFRVNFGP